MCTTMFAAVRFSPVPPAFSDSSIAGGPSGCWKSATMESRRDLVTPPCKNGTSRPSCSDRYGCRIAPKALYWVKMSTRSPLSTA